MSIVVAYGSRGYADDWHDFAGIAAALAHVLTPYGDVELSDDVERALLSLAHDRPELLVLCAGVGPEGAPAREERLSLVRYLDGGGRLLALHSAATMFPAWHDWERLLGGRWVREVSSHPPYGSGTVAVPGPPARTFEIADEFYEGLRVGEVEVIATHEDRPLAWRHRVGAGRVVYDALGHTPATYDSSGRRALLDDELAWLGLRPRSLGATDPSVDRVLG